MGSAARKGWLARASKSIKAQLRAARSGVLGKVDITGSGPYKGKVSAKARRNLSILVEMHFNNPA
nr:hypothetical protein FFPRI1PSEUD_58680 [Pseudomonas sp. FFPRI_1]